MSRPRYRRNRPHKIKGWLDIITSEFIRYTPQELADQAFERKFGMLVAGFIIAGTLAAAVIVGVIVAFQFGVLS